MNIDQEFKQIPSWPDHEISQFGTVRRRVAGKTRPKGWIVKATLNREGYARVKLSHGGIKGSEFIHRLVLKSWVRLPEEGEVARHLDGNPLNNHVSNLAWGIVQDNIDDRTRHGNSPHGLRNGRAKLTQQQVDAMRQEYEGKRGDIRRLSKKYDVAYSQAREIIYFESWVANVKPI